MADDGGISDNAIVGEVRREPVGGGGGWASLGHALGGGLGGANTIAGETAYENGMRVGAQTADALAQAKDRVQKSDSADQAAKALQSPELQAQLHLTPELGNYFATQARMGKNPEEVTQMMLQNQQYQMRNRIADTSQPLDQRHAAAFAEAPASMAPKAEGPLGSVFDPGANGGSGQTQVSPLQQQVAEAGVGLKDAQAAAAPVNAAAHATQAANSGAGSGKLLTGNKWVADPQDPSGVLHDSTGQAVQAPDLNANKGEGAVSERNTRRMVIAAQGLAKEASNLSKIGLSESTGMQVSGSGKGVFGTASENMGKAFSTDAQQNYKSSIAGMERQLATLELAGGIPPGTYVNQLKTAVANDPSDTPSNRLFHASIFRQIAEVAAESAHASPKMDVQSKNAIYDAVEKVQKAIPFTASEVQDYRRDGKKGQTFQQYLDSAQRDAPESFRDGSTPAAPATGGQKPTAPTADDPLGILGKK